MTMSPTVGPRVVQRAASGTTAMPQRWVAQAELLLCSIVLTPCPVQPHPQGAWPVLLMLSITQHAQLVQATASCHSCTPAELLHLARPEACSVCRTTRHTAAGPQAPTQAAGGPPSRCLCARWGPCAPCAPAWACPCPSGGSACSVRYTARHLVLRHNAPGRPCAGCTDHKSCSRTLV